MLSEAPVSLGFVVVFSRSRLLRRRPAEIEYCRQALELCWPGLGLSFGIALASAASAVQRQGHSLGVSAALVSPEKPEGSVSILFDRSAPHYEILE